MDAGGEEGFIGVDVSETGDAGLVEEEVFYNSFAFKNLRKFSDVDFFGFGADFG